MATIIIKNSTGSGNTPTLVQGEFAINTADGLLFYGSGSVAKVFTSSLSTTSSYSISSSYAESASYALSSSYAVSASYASSSLYAGTSSNILGGKATHVPYFITDTTLATSSIYQSGSTSVIINSDVNTTANPEALFVEQTHPTSFNVISGKGNLNNYLQLNIQNRNAGTSVSSDVVATANNGDENGNYIDMGINGSNFSGIVGNPNDAYLYSTGSDLHIGNATPNKPIQFFAGGFDTNTNRKLQLSPNNSHQMTGSLDVSGSVKAFSFTGSLLGTATNATIASTASYVAASNVVGTVTSASHANQADNATTADYASTAGNGGVTSIVAGSGITLIPTSGVGSVTVISSGGGGVTIISGSNVTQSFNNTSTWTFDHNLGTRVPIITVFDTNYKQIIPQDIELVNTSSATITFPTAESGFAVASLGGTTGTVLSSSYALFSTYATTASNYAETDPVFAAKSASLATTGSNIFKGNQTVTGSLFTSGSNTLIGNTTLTGSFSVSGSTTQTGNNTLIGNTVLSGSISVSGSQTFKGNMDLTGSLTISGSTTQIGNNTLFGNTILTGSVTISGSTFFVGDIVPTISSSFDLGSVTNPWRSIYLQSGSISIRSDIPGGPDTIISNTNGNVSITSAGFQLKSGSVIPFQVDTTGRTSLIVPTIPANDIGGLSIIGSSNGAYQPVINPSGMLHITSNDNQAARVTVDGFGTSIGAIFVGRQARGTAAIPTQTLSGDVLVRFAGLGYATSSYFPVVNAVPTSLEFQATENYSTSSYGSKAAFYTYANGAVSRSLVTTIDTTGITIPSTSKFFGTASWANNAQTASFLPVGTYNVTASWAVSASQAISASFAQTASYVKNAQTSSYINSLNQDVIITGSLRVSGSFTELGNTTFSGSVTINSGSALNINDGFYVSGNKQFQYASFFHTASQTVTGTTIAVPFQFSTIENNSGAFTVELSGSRRSRITTNTSGWWNIQYSAQATNSSGFTDYTSYMWIRVNESNVANSNNIRTIPQNSFNILASRNILIYLASGSYFEIMYAASNTAVSFPYTAAGASPTRPATPSITCIVTQHA